MNTLLLITILLAVIATGFFLVYRLNQIHVLVNSRLTAALDAVKDLKERLGIPTGDDPEPEATRGDKP